MAYSNVPIGTSNPGCIVILVDQSWSMSEEWETGTKADVAARAVNRILEELLLACRSGDQIRDRCYITVIGYGEEVSIIYSDMISKLDSARIEFKEGKKSIPDGAGGVVEVPVKLPIWLQPKAANGTPMHTAFESASEIVRAWCEKLPDGFPPTVINITDGNANYPEKTSVAAKGVMNLGTTDGSILVFNMHIAKSGFKIVFPNSTDQFQQDSLSRFLFEHSSILPDSLFATAESAGFSLEHGARCFGYNLDEATMIKLLNFGSLDVTQVRALPLLPD